MKIVVCIKQVPDTADIKWTKNNTLEREGMDSVINPFDEFAIETALLIKDEQPQTVVTAISMGPNQAQKSLKDALAVGCDEAVLLCDKKFAGSDTVATSKIIAKGIKNSLSDFDLVICGQFATDGDTAQTGAGIAQNLDIPQATYVKKVVEVNEKYIVVEKEGEYGIETLKIQLPALICMQKCDYDLRQAKINGYIYAQDKEIRILNASDINISDEDAGIKGSPTYVNKAFRPENTRILNVLDGNSDEKASKIMEIIKGVND